jgi:hypothetical protein
MPILAGFEVPSGRRFEIPDEGHIGIFGQTQLSGKTTALEAIAFRGHLKTIAFVTKQGEGGFLTGKGIPPYFSEPTNDEENPLWRWVKAILESNVRRTLRFEESWIISACERPRQAQTLADVQANIKSLLSGEGEYIEKGRGRKRKREWKYIRKPVTGLNAGVYTSLNAYFSIVMPQLARLPYVKKLELHPGVNVMDLRDYAMETQALVIRSVLEAVYQYEKNVRVIVPEVQDFIPQGRNSPVKMAAENFIRKGGANKNFMWVDGQDMAAVDKFVLRACSIVAVGVQTEAHEIDRSLATIFSPALKPIDIARLKIGEFFVRTPEARVTKIYVQPCFIDSELHAQAIAKGEESVSSARQMLRAFKQTREQVVGDREAGKKVLSPPQLLQLQTQESPYQENSNQGDEADGQHHDAKNSSHPGSGKGTGDAEERRETSEMDETVSGAPVSGVGSESEVDEKMWREKYEALQAEHKTLIEAHDALAKRVRELEDTTHGLRVPKHESPATGNGRPSHYDLNFIYDEIKHRAQKDPGILEILTKKPELRVKVERPVIQVDGGTLRGQLALLVKKGFFDSPVNGNSAFKEVMRLGKKVAKPNVYRELDGLAELGFLTKEEGGYQMVAEMKIQIAGGRE